MGVFGERGKPEYPEKNPRSEGTNKLRPHMTHRIGESNPATLVGGEWSHHYATPSPPLLLMYANKFETKENKI